MVVVAACGRNGDKAPPSKAAEPEIEDRPVPMTVKTTFDTVHTDALASSADGATLRATQAVPTHRAASTGPNP